jgi:hypothetical protein
LEGGVEYGGRIEREVVLVVAVRTGRGGDDDGTAEVM